jgi:hypothetical protein
MFCHADEYRLLDMAERLAKKLDPQHPAPSNP